MAEDKFSSNSRSPRFSTSKALGFRGGSTNPQTGNLQQPSYLQTAGINTAKPPVSASDAERNVNPAISQFSAKAPQPSAAGTIASGVATSVGGEVAKQGLKKAGNAIGSAVSNYMTPKGYLPSGGYSSGTMSQSFAGPDNMSVDPALAGERNPVMELGGRPDVPSFLSPDNLTGSDGGDWVSGQDLAGGADFASSAGDVAGAGDWTSGYDLAGGGDAASAGLDASGVPIVGPLMRLAQGDYGGAAGSAAGGAIGTMILPGIGTAIGSALGGALGSSCFITEAVMSAGGQGDTAPELESLRQFRDQVLSTTPQGQALIQEYESIAPMVVEAVMQRPDSMQVFQSIDAQFIKPAVDAVNQGDFQKALQIYAQMISFVTPLAMEGGEGETMPAGAGGADPDAMQEMGEHAAMIGHSPEMAGAATGGMGATGLDQDPNGYDGGPQGPQGQSAMMQQFAQPRY